MSKLNNDSLTGASAVMKKLRAEAQTNNVGAGANIDRYIDNAKQAKGKPNKVDDKIIRNAANEILEIDPSNIKRWEYKDRPENELGDIQSLSEEFKTIGQQQPCIVREISSESGREFELLLGERRWRAAEMAKIKLKVVLSTMDDTQAALAQSAENDSRQNLSDYAKGMSYSKLIKDGVLQQKDLVERLGKSRQSISALLSFGRIPKEISEAIGDMSKVSAKTAEKLASFSNKGPEYIESIISLSDKIREGKLGWEKIASLVNTSLNNDKRSFRENKKIFSRDGRHIFTWRNDNNTLPSIHFPKQINKLFIENKIDIDLLTNEFLNIMEKKIKEL